MKITMNPIMGLLDFEWAGDDHRRHLSDEDSEGVFQIEDLLIEKKICTGCVFFKIEEYFHVVECSVER